MPKRRPFRGKARYMPGGREIERTTGQPWLPQRHELDYYRVLDWVLAEHQELQGKDPSLVAICDLVRKRAWAELESILVFHHLMLSLGETDRGDLKGIEYLLGNRFPESWRDVRRIQLSGHITSTEEKILTVEIVDGTGNNAFKERVPIEATTSP